jgi:hypothetical protein
MIEPSEDNFKRVPIMFRPTTLQLLIPHPPLFDFVFWPQMRDNLIKYGMKYCTAHVFGLFFCTCRVRDTANTDIIAPNEGSDPKVDPNFLAKISTVDGWVLLDKFWAEYPELVEGMDPSKFQISEQDLK